MKIIDVTTTQLFYPHARPLRNATILPDASGAGGLGQLLVHIKTDEGVEGLGVGEAPPGVRQVVESGFKELLIDQDPFDIEKIRHRLFWRSHRYGRQGIASRAASAIDIGLWDLKAKALGLPLYRLLGAFTDTVPIYGSGGWTDFSEQELVAEMTGHVEQGIKAVKMKIGKDMGKSEREDIERVAAVRKAVGDDVALYVDVNSGYYAKQAIYMCKEFEQYQVGWIEEPVLADDLTGLAEIRRAVSIPVATGEDGVHQAGLQRADLWRRGRHRPAGCPADRRRDRVDEGGPPGRGVRPAYGAARSTARPPSRCVRYPQSEGRGVYEPLPGGGPALVHRVPRTQGRHVVSIP